ncbi:TPA: helix-turn-helix domain-containing protein [Serratia marcescens]
MGSVQDLETLDKLCELFNCQLGDLLERVPGSTPGSAIR